MIENRIILLDTDPEIETVGHDRSNHGLGLGNTYRVLGVLAPHRNIP